MSVNHDWIPTEWKQKWALEYFQNLNKGNKMNEHIQTNQDLVIGTPVVTEGRKLTDDELAKLLAASDTYQTAEDLDRDEDVADTTEEAEVEDRITIH